MEFRFKPSQEWDLTMPGRLHVLLREAYRGKPREERHFEASLLAAAGAAAGVSVRQGLGRVQLVSEDGTRIVAIGPDVLSVHMLRPYQSAGAERGWDEFRPRIEAALNAYWQVCEPSGVLRIGLRYINKIVLAESDADLSRFLTTAPSRVQGLPEDFAGFAARSNYVYPDGVQLFVTHATADAVDDQRAILVDVDLGMESDDVLSQEAALRTADDLRIRERDAFESLITDAAREIFDAG